MKRFITTLALLLACAGLGQAHYVIIRLNLGAPPAGQPAGAVIGQPNLPGAIGGLKPLMPLQPQPGVKAPLLPPPPPGGTISVIVLLEYHKQGPVIDPFTKQPASNRIMLDHAWGRTYLGFDQKTIMAYPLMDEGFKGKKVHRPSVLQTYDARLGAFDKGTPAGKFVELAEWALTNGLEAKVPDLLKQAADRNQGNPDPAVAKVLDVFDKATKQMAQALQRDENYLSPKALEGKKVAKSEHFTLYYDAPAGSTPEVDARLKKLEQHYRAFYYWFALRGKVLPAPERRMVTMLIDRPVDFRNYYSAYGSPPLAGDGFFSPRENLTVFSSMPLDQPYDLASRQFRELAQLGWDFRGLLNPKLQMPRGKTADEIVYAQSMALIQKALHEESELATVSHTATRQLLTSSGILPRTVLLPDWIQTGLASFFETPKFSQESLTGAFWTTYGAPHWVYHAMWRDLEERKALDAPEEALLNVVTDRYSREARFYPREQSRARMMAWSLTYYLAHRRLDQLLAYCKELSSLPRDLELDDEVYLGCFARAFDVAGPGGKGIDQAKFDALAQEWYKYVGILQFPEVSQDTQKVLGDMRRKGP